MDKASCKPSSPDLSDFPLVLTTTPGSTSDKGSDNSLVTDHGSSKDNMLPPKDLPTKSSRSLSDLGINVVLEPYSPDKVNTKTILFVKKTPLTWSFDIVYEKFAKFGEIKELRNRLGSKNSFFETWVKFVSPSDALRAYQEFDLENKEMQCSLVDSHPLNLDLYRPPDLSEDSLENSLRSPDPPRWIIITMLGDRGNLFKLKKLLNQRLGQNKPDIKRFGRNSFLAHTKSDGQAVMLLNLRKDSESSIKDIKPHYSFSYSKGVIFNQDLYDLPEDEILDMCPDNVWKIFKVPRSSMIILTFANSHLPNEIVLDKEFMRVRPYRPRILQCYNCYQFGHASRVCVRNKVCQFCSQPDHGECDRSFSCVNCKGGHHARDKTCKMIMKEQEALLKSLDEHISVGHAKKLLNKTTYSEIVKVPKNTTTTSANHNPSPDGSSAPSGGGFWAPPAGAPRAPSGGASRAPSGGAPRASVQEASRASVQEASQEGSLPRTVESQAEGLLLVPHIVEVHAINQQKSKTAVSKRPRTPSPSPPQTPDKGGSKSYHKPDQKNKGASHNKNHHKGKPNLSRPPGRKPSKTPKGI